MFTGTTLYYVANPPVSELDIEQQKLSIEKDRLIIQKMKLEIQSEQPSNDTITKTAQIISQNPKVAVRRSNFYKNINEYNKVIQIGVSTLQQDNTNLSDEEIVLRKDFGRFILPTHNLPTLTDESATIEIIAPVLNDGKSKWKGIYNDSPISFSMNDLVFKEDVLSKKVSFQNGSSIICVLQVKRTLNEVGEPKKPEYIVTTVLDKVDNNIIKETEGGKRYRHQKKQDERQTELF